MDHCQGQFVDVQLDVLLCRQGLPVAAGKTRNVSRAGAFVETGYGPENGNLYVEVAFIPGIATETGVYHVNGLIIDDYDPESRLPTRMIYAGQAEPDREGLL